jgi:hypothetical protein
MKEGNMQITYTVYDSEDSSWYRNGLSLQEATELRDDRDNNGRYDRHMIVTDADFDKIQSNPEDSHHMRKDADGITWIL